MKLYSKGPIKIVCNINFYKHPYTCVIILHISPSEGPGVVSCTNGWVSSSASELVVSWEEPESPNGIITSYYLELHEYQATGAAIATREIIDNSTNTTFSGLMLGQHCAYG